LVSNGIKVSFRMISSAPFAVHLSSVADDVDDDVGTWIWMVLILMRTDLGDEPDMPAGDIYDPTPSARGVN
jgi:hypothetical protein